MRVVTSLWDWYPYLGEENRPELFLSLPLRAPQEGRCPQTRKRAQPGTESVGTLALDVQSPEL